MDNKRENLIADYDVCSCQIILLVFKLAYSFYQL